MVKSNIHPVVLSYLDDHKQHFYVFEKGEDGTGLVTARGWEDLSVMLRMMEERGFAVDLAFVAQYLQSAQVAREFVSYYGVYSAIIASGVADAVLTAPLTAAREKQVEDMSFPEQFALTAVLQMRLEAMCQQQGARGMAALDRTIRFFGEYLPDSPQEEFFLRGVTNADPIALCIARQGCPAYKAAAERVLLDRGGKLSRKELQQLVQT